MKLVNQASLARGRILMDYAQLGEELAAKLKPADLVGLVAAYINWGHPTHDIQERLSTRLSPAIADRAALTFEMFDDQRGRGLWSQGPAIDDITFTHPKLQKLYPKVQQRQGNPNSNFLGLIGSDVPF